MRIDIITLFPEMFAPVLGESIIGRAQKSGAVEIHTHQLRDYALDKHRRVDDTPYGGGMGMLMKAEPIALCFEAICAEVGARPHFVYMSPQGKTLRQQRLRELAEATENICILCGHYEGVDQRVLDRYIDEEISIGDYVLTGVLYRGEPLWRSARISAVHQARRVARHGGAGDPAQRSPSKHRKMAA